MGRGVGGEIVINRLNERGIVFFFQAEDGIRDAQESRGLGDVYKRQVQEVATSSSAESGKTLPLNAVAFSCRSGREAPADWTGLPGSIARREMREDPAVRSQIRDSRRSGDFTGRKTV